MEAVNDTKDGKDTITVRKTLSKVGEELRAFKYFIQVNKGYLVNIQKIRKYIAEEVIMVNGDKLVVGRMHVARVKK